MKHFSFKAKSQLIGALLAFSTTCLAINRVVICSDDVKDDTTSRLGVASQTEASVPARGIFWTLSPTAGAATSRSTTGLQLARDEFNTTEDPFKRSKFAISVKSSGGSAAAAASSTKEVFALFKKVLLRYDLDECCPSWTNLTQNADILEEQKRLLGKNSGKQSTLKASELLNEIKQVYVNITYLSIDGQQGDNELEKYYKFYDDVHYYLRLMIVAQNYLTELEQRIAAADVAATAAVANRSASSVVSDIDRAINDLKTKHKLQQEDIDFKRYFTRQIRSISFRVSQDPILSSFIQELLLSSSDSEGAQLLTPSARLDDANNQQKQQLEEKNSTQSKLDNHSGRDKFVLNENFESYETFIRYTNFGQYYASNISMVRESVQVFDLICSHLNQVNFLSNLTRPSKQYEIIRRMSYELFKIRHDLLDNISLRVLSQNQDVKRIFNKLNDLIVTQPHIRMLGDEFSTDDLLGFSDNVRRLTHLLDLYTANNMTHLSFYNQLSELPEDFIMLGVAVAREYEIRELPQYKRFNSDLYNWEQYQNNLSDHQEQLRRQKEQSHEANDTQSAPTDSARQSNRPFLSKLFG